MAVTTVPLQTNTLKAVLWMMGALASFTTMALAGRELTQEMSVFQALSFRSIICVAVLTGIAAFRRFEGIRTERIGLHLARNTVHFAGQFGWVYGLSLLPLAAVFSIEFTVPIWTAILAAMFLGEPFTRWRMIAVAMGFVGILIVVRPGAAMLDVAAFAVLGAAMAYAATYVFTRHMASTERPFAIVFWMNLIQLPLGLIPALTMWVTPSPENYIWIAAIGLGGLCSHWCVAHAMRHADAAVVAPMDFIRLPIIAVIGYLFYAEPWNPYVLIGGVLIFSGNMINLWGERRRR
ncbi:MULTISPECIES: DMT family transporter [Thalassobaculum]|uniref:Permease of the drug/metabolite transporter (DMT) superfamily n=1 Tax=Thalassobaculum litoreum DSM 18839 TaxID=1123362 RepID=A0A8G2EYX1_9PROT|nr:MULTISPECIES: DMT family transporter [Thalassobaculum]SDG00871.1 Permease of the drug/metabolite transporter (DMT) superfamily [Thalassobaculum litoreum DSM 18839]